MTKQEAINILHKSNCKLTPQRDILLDILLANEGYLMATDVYNRIKDYFPSISPDTVYRNLKLLYSIGILSKSNIGRNTMYEARKNAHTHIMRCLICGKQKELDICPLDYCLSGIKNFEVTEHHIEILGYCDECMHRKEKN